jgi:hypothetical protein
MFGYEGEKANELSRMIAARIAAQAKWPFLTTLDLSMIHNQVQLSGIVRDRTGVSKKDAENDVQSWMVGQGLAVSGSATATQRWNDDGGANRGEQA